jgi:NADP-dependent 3-hydroxy acid dehydrogenase YdfG
MTTPAAGRRVWLITGATSGFGRSLTEEVVRQGDIVVAAARGIGRLDDLKSAYADRLFPVTLDVTDTARDGEVVRETVERHGRLDVLVNNAGVLRSAPWKKRPTPRCGPCSSFTTSAPPP